MRRRENIIENFGLERQDLQRQFENSATFYSQDRNNLLEGKNNSAWGKETSVTVNFDNRQLIDRQKQTMDGNFLFLFYILFI